MIKKLTTPIIILIFFIGSVFLAAAVYETSLCKEFIAVMGVEQMQASDMIPYVIDRCASLYGFGLLHMSVGFVALLLKKNREDAHVEGDK